MFDVELRDLLAELAEQIGAIAVSISEGRAEDESVPLGKGLYLCARFRHNSNNLDAFKERIPSPREHLERSARAIRAAALRWNVDNLPHAVHPPTNISPRGRLRNRIDTFVRALKTSSGAANVVLVRRGDILLSAEPIGDVEAERIPFIIRQVGAQQRANRGRSSHGELRRDDHYAVSFYFDAYLVSFFGAGYAPDFVRHRNRIVARELCKLLPLLDEPPDDPATIAPVPE